MGNTTQWTGVPDFTHGDDDTSQTMDINLTEVTLARYISLVQPRNELIIVCELEVYKRGTL